jgi:hypothetical protein
VLMRRKTKQIEACPIFRYKPDVQDDIKWSKEWTGILQVQGLYLEMSVWNKKKPIVNCLKPIPFMTNSAVNGLQVFVRRRSFVRLSNSSVIDLFCLKYQTDQSRFRDFKIHKESHQQYRSLPDWTTGQNSLVLYWWQRVITFVSYRWIKSQNYILTTFEHLYFPSLCWLWIIGKI